MPKAIVANNTSYNSYVFMLVAWCARDAGEASRWGLVLRWFAGGDVCCVRCSVLIWWVVWRNIFVFIVWCNVCGRAFICQDGGNLSACSSSDLCVQSTRCARVEAHVCYHLNDCSDLNNVGKCRKTREVARSNPTDSMCCLCSYLSNTHHSKTVFNTNKLKLAKYAQL